MSATTISTAMRADFLTDIENRWPTGYAPVDGPALTAMCDVIARAITNGNAPIATLAALTLLDGTSEPDGQAYYVNEVEDWYILEKASAHVADGLAVIAAVGGGYWVSRMVGRWDDLQGTIAEGDNTGALTWEVYRDTPFKMAFFHYLQDDKLSYVWQLPHRWKQGTKVYPHLHCIPMSAPASPQDLYFTIKYYWCITGSAVPGVASWTDAAPVTHTIAAADQFKLLIIGMGGITPPALAKESSILLYQLTRVGTSALDTYTTNKTGGTVQANLALVSSDLHYQANKPGTEAEFPA